MTVNILSYLLYISILWNLGSNDILLRVHISPKNKDILLHNHHIVTRKEINNSLVSAHIQISPNCPQNAFNSTL